MMITLLDITGLRNTFFKVSLSCFKAVSKSVQSFPTNQAKGGGMRNVFKNCTLHTVFQVQRALTGPNGPALCPSPRGPISAGAQYLHPALSPPDPWLDFPHSCRTWPIILPYRMVPKPSVDPICHQPGWDPGGLVATVLLVLGSPSALSCLPLGAALMCAFPP